MNNISELKFDDKNFNKHTEYGMSLLEKSLSKFGAWALEEHFDRFLGLRQKCYITEVEGKVHVTVAGLPQYLAPLVTFENFKKGFSTAGMTLPMMRKIARENGASDEEVRKIHHKLRYHYVDGGVILEDTDFTIK